MEKQAGILSAHGDSSYVPEEFIREIPSPEFTTTWHPYSHAQVISITEKAAEQAGVLSLINDRRYSITKKQDNMFAVWNLKEDLGGINTAIGFRNSTSKQLSVGYTAGTRVFVCDNLAFSGEWITMHKHTGNLDPSDLFNMCLDAFTRMKEIMSKFVTWQVGLKNFELGDHDLKEITFNAMRQEVLPPSKFNGFIDLYDQNTQVYGANLRSWFEANTELMKGNSLAGQGILKNEDITRYVNKYIEIKSDPEYSVN